MTASRLFSYVGAPVGNGPDVTVDPLFSFVVPAGSLGSDGALLHVWAAGQCTADASTKQVSLQMDGLSIAAMNIDVDKTNWRMDVWITRTAPQAFRRQKIGFADAGLPHLAANELSPGTVNWSDDVVLVFAAQNQTQPVADTIEGSDFVVMLWP